MKIQGIKLHLFPVEEVHCGYGLQQGNVLPSLSYVPGRVLRGGLGGWAIRAGCVTGAKDNRFEKLFLSDEDPFKISFPCCTYKGLLPAPLSLFQPKGSVRDPETALATEDIRVISKAKKINLTSCSGPLDFLNRDEWPSDIDMTLKSAKGCVIDAYLQVMQGLSPCIDLKSRHDKDKRRVVEKGLFAEESLPAAVPFEPTRHYYKGTVYFEEDEETAAIFEKLKDGSFRDPEDLKSESLTDPDPQRIVFLGHRRVPVLVYAVDIEEEQMNKDIVLSKGNNEKQFTITFLSDLVSGQTNPFPLTAEMVRDATGLTGLKKERAFCDRGTAYGFDVIKNRKLNPKATIAAGSCILLKANGFDATALNTLREKSFIGMGNNTRDGFGRFEINWPIHHLTS